MAEGGEAFHAMVDAPAGLVDPEYARQGLVGDTDPFSAQAVDMPRAVGSHFRQILETERPVGFGGTGKYLADQTVRFDCAETPRQHCVNGAQQIGIRYMVSFHYRQKKFVQ